MTKASIPLLLVLTICQANLLLGNSLGAQADNSNELDYRLPEDAVPSVYELNLEPDLKKFTFTGTAKITIVVKAGTTRLTLNAKNLNVTEKDVSLSPVNSSSVITATKVELKEKQEFLVISVKDSLNGTYVLTINYTGELNDKARGFYRSRYFDKDRTVKYVAATHFEPTGARQAFPCWDEPAYKAVYKIALTHETNYKAISNMPEKSNTTVQNKTKTVFQDTPKMSSYLVAFVVSDYGVKESGSFRVWTKSHAVDQGAYALEMGKKLLDKLDAYTNIFYSKIMPKMDQVTLKDFSPSAMENWGLVTYRESALLYKESETTLRTKQSITTIIAHEFAHQWFGNLVSPKWWTYLWLNEGFATYFQYFIANEVVPEWQLNEVRVVDSIQGNAFIADAAENVRPMNKEVNSPEEISGLFDSIAYQKAGAVIRMMSSILTEDVFKEGLRKYISDNIYSAADSADLFKALGAVAKGTWENGVTFDVLMDEWVNKPGYPVVNVRNNGEKYEITQERFSLYGNKDDTKWWVPITFVKQANPRNFSTTPTHWLQPNKNLTIDEKEKDKWIIVNVQQAGYYRVNYDEENWVSLTKYLRSPDYNNVDVINRAQLIDDALNMARSNRLNYTVALSLSLYLKNETNYVPWQAAFRNLNFLQNMMRTSNKYSFFKSRSADLHSFALQPSLKVLKMSSKSLKMSKRRLNNIKMSLKLDVANYTNNDTDVTILLRTNAMKWACRAGVTKCTDYATSEFKDWVKLSNKTLDVNLKNNILCAGLNAADNATWNKAFEELKKTINEEDDNKSAFSTLTCTDSQDRLKQYLLWSLEKESPVSFDAAVQAVVSEHPEEVDHVLNVLTSVKEQISKLDNKDSVIKSVIETIGNAITTKEQHTQLSFFVLSEHVKPELLHSSLLRAMRNIEWIDSHRKTVEDWLVAHESEFNSASSLVLSSFLLILSIFITRFN
ncbi:PREDICTED: aminopeptidase N-like [Habropoda laboriosa]|uniref:aminopeptidase N-like n=1 Tax=Habropoda laboriosa TaxID=597456 RepID=UPI00083D1706|nr:PREDICTED: aminopeptidase N-like [Habropoda laboriosa]